MKRIGFAGLGISSVVMMIAVVLLLNLTAQNPTGRRYSSVPVTTVGNFRDIGAEGEIVLSSDLGLPVNEVLSQPQCICDNAKPAIVPSGCGVCYAYSQITYSTSSVGYRVPDFVSPNFIADSKNVRDLPYSDQRLRYQIGDYAVAARAQNVPLWVYVRTDTEVDPEFYRMVRETGGDIVPYFAGRAYVDSVDQAAQYGAGVSVVGLFFFGGWVMLAGSGRLRWRGGGGSRPRKPSSPNPKDPLSQAMRSVDTAESFKNQTKDSSRRSIDESDSREDL